MNALPKTKETSNLRLVPPTIESKKVSVDDGFTAIPNELLFAIGKFGFTQRQFNLLIAVIQKTLSWHKEMDWISNSQICELVDLPDEQKASKTKQELVRMNVLIQKGNQIGLNLVVSEWRKDDCTKGANIAQNAQRKLHKSCNSDCTKGANTKETITKQKINNTPFIPQGGEQAVGADKNSAMPKKSRNSAIDYQAVADLYNQANEETGSRLPMVKGLNDKRRRAIAKFLKSLKEPTLACAEKYFGVFFQDITPHQLGKNDRGWRANFDFAIREDVILRVREGAL